MDHTHEYDCIVCGSHFESSEDLAEHNEKAHLQNAKGMERPRNTKGDVPGARTDPKPDWEQDRNPRQGFTDPRADRSSST